MRGRFPGLCPKAKNKICSNRLCNLLKANELRTIFDILATSWLSGDNNSPSSLNYIRPSLNYIRPCSANKATCHLYIGPISSSISDLLYKKNSSFVPFGYLRRQKVAYERNLSDVGFPQSTSPRMTRGGHDADGLSVQLTRRVGFTTLVRLRHRQARRNFASR